MTTNLTNLTNRSDGDMTRGRVPSARHRERQASTRFLIRQIREIRGRRPASSLESGFHRSLTIRLRFESIFSICNAVCQGGLLTLPDVPPSVCYPSGRHRQRRGPKPGGQRSLDPRIGRGTREPTRRLPASRRSGASSPGQVNPGEVLIKAVIQRQAKDADRLGPKRYVVRYRGSEFPCRG